MAKKDRSKTHMIHRIKAQDKSGEWAQYFVLIEKAKEAAFIKAAKGKADIDLKQYGTVVASYYGNKPPDEVKRLLLEKFDVKI
jgi:hypothetical protein